MQKFRELWARIQPHVAGGLSGAFALVAVYITLGQDIFRSEPSLRDSITLGTVIQPVGKSSFSSLARISADKALSGGENTLAIYNYDEICREKSQLSELNFLEKVAIAEKSKDKLVVNRMYNIQEIEKLCNNKSAFSDFYIVSNSDLTIPRGGQLVRIQRSDVGIKEHTAR